MLSAACFIYNKSCMGMNWSLLLSISLWKARRRSYYLFNQQFLYAETTLEWTGNKMLSHNSVLKWLKFYFVLFFLHHFNLCKALC